MVNEGFAARFVKGLCEEAQCVRVGCHKGNEVVGNFLDTRVSCRFA